MCSVSEHSWGSSCLFGPFTAPCFSVFAVCVNLIGCTRVASVQSEPGQQNLLIQPPLGRKRGLRQVRTSDLQVATLDKCAEFDG